MWITLTSATEANKTLDFLRCNINISPWIDMLSLSLCCMLNREAAVTNFSLWFDPLKTLTHDLLHFFNLMIKMFKQIYIYIYVYMCICVHMYEYAFLCRGGSRGGGGGPHPARAPP
jgi:hypothetical protein